MGADEYRWGIIQRAFRGAGNLPCKSVAIRLRICYIPFFRNNPVGKALRMKCLKWCVPLFCFFFTAESAHAIAPAPAPEPGILLLLGAGLVALAIWGYRKRKKKTSPKP
jgi:hypothetical protein